LIDAIIIGAGPAGLVAAQELLDKNILVIEKGPPVSERTSPVEGVGGAGGWSDGKLCFGPVGILDRYLGDHYPAEARSINQIFRDVLGDKYEHGESFKRANFHNSGEELTHEVTEVVNLGTSTVRLLFQQMYENVRKRGRVIITNDPVVKVNSDDKDIFVVRTKSGREFHSRNLIVATGKGDITIVPQLIESYKLETTPTKPTLGLRLVIPNEEMARIKSLGENPKIKLHLPNGDIVKTHCLVFGGEVIVYASGNYFLVGGGADRQKPTGLSNINILYKFSSGNPDNSKQLIRATLARINKDYPRNVIYQDIRSFLDPAREPKEIDFSICRDGKLGNLLQYYPPHVSESIREFIHKMANTYGINLMNKAFVVGPSVEWLADAVITSMEMETAVKGLFIVGDGAGITQGIIAAAVTGLRAAHSIRDRL